MNTRRIIPFLAFVLLGSFITLGYAAKGGTKGGTPLVGTVLDNQSSTGYGVSGDGNGTYVDGVGGVQCYFGVNGKDADLVTYNSGRTLRFEFDPNSPAWQNSDLPQSDFNAEIDFFGINYWGRYMDMGIGTTAQVQMDLEFKVGRLTYELDYQSLAVIRESATKWLITSDPADIPGDPGFTASDQANLNVIRRRAQETFGAVNMPLRVELTLK
ncbi:MAG: hypothetical protein HYS33_00055, partial [Acidobacteria bacterium]|nr:hypothetical protein [Acidobacteriota bacterium]